MGGKSAIKEIFRRQFPRAVRTVRKAANEGKNTFVPASEPTDTSQTLQNATYVVEDTGVRFHGYNNVERINVRSANAEYRPGGVKRAARQAAGDDDDGGGVRVVGFEGAADDPDDDDNADEEPGYRVSGARGDALVAFVLAPVRRVFALHPRIRTYIMVMDKGCFMPRPKHYVQALRTESMVETMERQGIPPLEIEEGAPLPVIVAADKILPAWLSVRANRTLYRHATCETFDLLARTYKPPPGCRLIIDCLDRAATSPETLDDWMVSDRLLCDDYARQRIEETRELMRGRSDWRSVTRSVLNVLAHGGHVESLSICIETSLEGVTYEPFVLRNSGNTCGEADIGISFWLQNMQADRQHTTLEGHRTTVAPFNEAHAEFYDEEQLAEFRTRSAPNHPGPAPIAEQRKQANALLSAAKLQADSVFANYTEGGHVDLAADDEYARLAPAEQQAKRLVFKRHADNPCREPNRGLVFSVDTDFLSLLPLWYAQMCAETYESGKDASYCRDNAPLLCIGECQVTRAGWLQSFDDYYVKPKGASAKKRGAAADDDDDPGDEEVEEITTLLAGETPPPPPPAQPFAAHEIYDIAKLQDELNALLDTVDDTPDEETIDAKHFVARAASFATFCATCENDYLAGLYFVNRRDMFKAFLGVHGRLAKYEHGALVVVPDLYTNYIKLCYYNALQNARGKANKTELGADELTYVAMAALVKKKYKTGKDYTKKHMPPIDTLKLMYQRTQWWLIYAAASYRSITELLDDNQWGWPPGTVEIMV